MYRALCDAKTAIEMTLPAGLHLSGPNPRKSFEYGNVEYELVHTIHMSKLFSHDCNPIETRPLIAAADRTVAVVEHSVDEQDRDALTVQLRGSAARSSVPSPEDDSGRLRTPKPPRVEASVEASAWLPHRLELRIRCFVSSFVWDRPMGPSHCASLEPSEGPTTLAPGLAAAAAASVNTENHCKTKVFAGQNLFVRVCVLF